MVLLIGSPMVRLASAPGPSFADRTVITYDRGAERSRRPRRDPQHGRGAGRRPPRLIDTLAVGPVDIFASSGGAVNALALVARHPEQVRTLVAHEPPAGLSS
jgi:pimeloyl-ACP methyl ester carboxylesterase